MSTATARIAPHAITDRDFRMREGLVDQDVPVLAEGGWEQVKFRCPGGEIVLRKDPATPPWCEAVARTFADVMWLEPNWDSYDAPAIDARFVEAALALLQRVMRVDTPAPSIVPTNYGGVQLEWHTNGVDLEVEFVSPQRLSVTYENLSTGEEWEKEISVDLQPLVQAISDLSES